MQTKELKPITFKQAFVIVICLHLAAYVGITQLSAYRKTIKVDRLLKPIPTYAETSSKDWPSFIDETTNKAVSRIKTAIEPVVKTTADNLSTTITQAQQDLKEIKVDLPSKTATFNLIEQRRPKPETPFIAMNVVPVPIAHAKEPAIKQEIKIRTVPTPTSITLIAPTPKQNDKWVARPPQKKVPTPVVNRSVPPIRFQQRPVDRSQKIHIIDGVEYIETKKVVSSRVTL